MARRNPWRCGCYECGGRLRTIGRVPPKTVECRSCGAVYRLTEENKIKSENALKRRRRRSPSVSADKYPHDIKPNWNKIIGNR
jgi:hypothetical protein